MIRRRQEFKAMGTYCSVEVAAETAEIAEEGVLISLTEMSRLEAKYSRFREDSVTSSINKSAGSGQWFAIDEETGYLLSFADRLYDCSDGRFDLTCTPFQRLWEQASELPSSKTVRATSQKIGQSRIIRDGLSILLPSDGICLDFGALVKEYACDRLVYQLLTTGVTAGCVSLGGDVRVFGGNMLERPWIIGVQDPFSLEGVLGPWQLIDGAIATSGSYERFTKIDGQHYSHIVDARSGKPVTQWLSVSVLAPNCLAAGAVATLACLFEENALEFLRSQRLWFLAIDRSGQMFQEG